MNNKYSIIILNALPDKKIKSLGNKYLIKINKKYHLVDYQIDFLNTLFDNPEIIIVGGFDGKRLKKYIDHNLYNHNIKYIEHPIDSNTNIGTSIKHAHRLIQNPNCLIINSSLVLHNSVKKFITQNLLTSFVLVNNDSKGNIGYIEHNNSIIHCYYDLPKTIFDCLYITNKDMDKFLKVCDSNIYQYYLFEIINKCIEENINIKPINITKKALSCIDNANSIQAIREKLCIK
jgi:hypothetical protein